MGEERRPERPGINDCYSTTIVILLTATRQTLRWHDIVPHTAQIRIIYIDNWQNFKLSSHSSSAVAAGTSACSPLHTQNHGNEVEGIQLSLLLEPTVIGERIMSTLILYDIPSFLIYATKQTSVLEETSSAFAVNKSLFARDDRCESLRSAKMRNDLHQVCGMTSYHGTFDFATISKQFLFTTIVSSPWGDAPPSDIIGYMESNLGQ
ncbi:4773_t:CDS:2 [Acaulospora morrowiae]|uniref:4773_t:CDS:1 n=1 Tax=Acaulospora morrowiae TaxID=94023 RepID=A0A9N8VA51_9GLOM|nr:4773_t:CDS:2 [Acaulospora morrowiae]